MYKYRTNIVYLNFLKNNLNENYSVYINEMQTNL